MERLPFTSFSRSCNTVETKSSARLCCRGIKAYAAINDREMNLIRRSTQLHIELMHPAVIHGIVQGLRCRTINSALERFIVRQNIERWRFLAR
jgi:hypothetical protein